MSMVIAVDTREKHPYTFSKYSTIKTKLDYGDYSICGFESQVSFERKNLDDYVASVIAQRDRFLEEIKNLANFEYRGILVEGTTEEILNKKYTSKANPTAIFGATTSIIVDFNVPVFFF